MIISKASKINTFYHLTLSRNTTNAITNALTTLTTKSKNPLIIAFGSVVPFKDTDFDVAQITDISTFNDDLKSIQTALASTKYDGVMLDSVSLLLRLLRANVAGADAPTLQEYGIINNRVVSALLILRASAPVFVSTASFVLDETATKKQNKEIWALDFTSNLSASILPMFGHVHYVANDGTVVTDRDLALAGKTPPKAKVTRTARSRK